MAIKDAKRINHFMPRPAFLKLLLERGLEQVGFKAFKWSNRSYRACTLSCQTMHFACMGYSTFEVFSRLLLYFSSSVGPAD